MTRKGGRIRKVFFLSLFSLTYLLLFMICAHILQHIDVLSYFDVMQTFMKSGMIIHVLMAGGFVVWGVSLLKQGRRSQTPSYGWLALVIPCPVCITVVFLSSAFLVSYFPDSGRLAVFLAYLTFMGIVALTVVGMSLWGIQSDSTPESDMGAAMLIIAAYFFLSVIIMPQFGDVDKIYRIAAYKGENPIADPREWIKVYAVMAVLFGAGFLYMLRKVKRSVPWT
jgi:predicted transporter